MKNTIVIIPTYNEVENIEDLIRAIYEESTEIHILIVDDNSPDLTAQSVYNLQKEFRDRLFVEVRPKKMGLGTAYVYGFKWCLSKSYDYIFEMDADFSHDPKDLKKLHHACHTRHADVAIGSRYITGVNVINWPMRRVIISYLASKYVRFITRMPIQDTTAGFVCYKRHVLKAINLDRITSTGYAFQIEMKFKAYLKRFKITEVSIIFRDRMKGESKLSSKVISEAIFGIITMKVKSMFSR